jgi:hypothetical protein
MLIGLGWLELNKMNQINQRFATIILKRWDLVELSQEAVSRSNHNLDRQVLFLISAIQELMTQFYLFFTTITLSN